MENSEARKVGRKRSFLNQSTTIYPLIHVSCLKRANCTNQINVKVYFRLKYVHAIISFCPVTVCNHRHGQRDQRTTRNHTNHPAPDRTPGAGKGDCKVGGGNDYEPYNYHSSKSGHSIHQRVPQRSDVFGHVKS